MSRTAEGDGLLTFSERVRLLTQAVLSVLALVGAMWAGLVWFMSQPVQAEARARSAADSLIVHRLDTTDSNIARLTRIAELQATFTLEQPGSPERARALAEFRAMRRLVP